MIAISATESWMHPQSPHLQQGHAAQPQLGFQNQQSYMIKHGQLSGFSEEQEGNPVKAVTPQPADYQLGYTKSAGRWKHLHSRPGLPILELHNPQALADSQPHMTFRKLANDVGTTSSTTAQVSPSIVVIIIVLTVIFFLSAFLHLLIRWLARNPALIRRGLRPGTNGGAGPNNRIIALTAIQGQLQQLFSIQDAGLERSLIEELPVFSYKAAMGGLKEGADCAICLCEFVGDDQLRLLPTCGHAFHTDCIDTWLISHSTCPLCRTLLLPECWLPGSLHPLLSSEVSTVGEVEHPQLMIDSMVPLQSGRSGGLGSSSRRSSLSRVTIIAGSTGPTQIDPIQCHEVSAAEHLLSQTGNTTLNPVESGASTGSSSVVRATSFSARLASFEHEKSRSSIESSKFDAFSEVENSAFHATKLSSNEATSSALRNSIISSTSAAAMSDSGHLSYISFGNNTDAQSARYSDQLERASPYGSGRRISVHLGKCRVVNEQNKRTRKSKARGTVPGRSYSKGSYEYVIDSSSNLEVLIPSPSNAHALISDSRLNDLLNLSHRVSTSLIGDAPIQVQAAAGNVPLDLGCRGLSPSWASASFRKLRLCSGGDPDASIEEELNAPLNTCQPSDCNRWPLAEIPKPLDHEESSTATSMRANVGSDASFSSDSASQKLQELTVLGNYEAGKNSHELETSKRAVSFRLPTPASHHVLSAKLRASASRRALSESDEALSYWEPCLTAEESIQLGHENDNRRVILDQKACSHRSSSFAKKTVDWLVGWPRRTVHPDKSGTNAG